MTLVSEISRHQCLILFKLVRSTCQRSSMLFITLSGDEKFTGRNVEYIQCDAKLLLNFDVSSSFTGRARLLKNRNGKVLELWLVEPGNKVPYQCRRWISTTLSLIASGKDFFIIWFRNLSCIFKTMKRRRSTSSKSLRLTFQLLQASYIDEDDHN